MFFRPARWMLALVGCLSILSTIVLPRAAAVASSAQPHDISYWGMNVYVTKRERLRSNYEDNLPLLASMARSAGVRWTREELPWDLIEPNNNDFRGVYDSSLRLTAEQGFGIIGMLLTTPAWARDSACAGNDRYWCPPANAVEYAQFAGWMVERYDGDGVADAPGSPRIAAWELWNEPNASGTWELGPATDAGRRRYGEMMVAAYRAIKAADPSALVLTGGVYVYDGSYCVRENCDGLVFLSGVFQQVPAARQAFDILAIHPYIPTDRPDAPNIPRLITVEGRVRNSRAWLNASGRSDARLWITEMGWCTASGVCPGDVQVTEDQQANYLVRSLVVAQHNGVEHSSWFQFEDAFNDPNREWSNAAIVRNYNGSSYPVKPAYNAYRTLAGYLGNAQVAGTGPVHTHVYDPSQPYTGSGGTYNYRYTRGWTVIDVLWRPTDSTQLSFPVKQGVQVTVVDRDGERRAVTPSNGAIQLTVSERPILVVQGDVEPRLAVSQNPVTFLVEVGSSTAASTLVISNSGSGIISWSASTPTSWLRLGTSSGVTPSVVELSADTRSMSLGTHTGSLTITGSNGSGVLELPVRVVVVRDLRRAYLPVVTNR